MITKFVRFNIYLCLALVLVSGCQSPADKEKKKKSKEATMISFHMEVSRDGADDNSLVPIFREHPIYLNVSKDPFLLTEDLNEAVIVEELGGYAIQCRFNPHGTLLLSSMTASNPGKHIAILCDFGEKRWVAAPVIRTSISNGVMTFTPDATREETERIVRGLSNFIKAAKRADRW